MSVLDNVRLAMNNNMRYSVLSGIFRLPAYWKEEKRVTQKAMEPVSYTHLDVYKRQGASQSQRYAACAVKSGAAMDKKGAGRYNNHNTAAGHSVV